MDFFKTTIVQHCIKTFNREERLLNRFGVSLINTRYYKKDCYVKETLISTQDIIMIHVHVSAKSQH